MHTTHLRKVGGSVMLAIPPAILDLLNLQSGAAVAVAVDDGRLIIQPQRRRYTLEELMAKCDSTMALSDEDRRWVDDKPVGSELI